MDNDSIRIAAVFMCHDGNGNYLLHKRTERCRDERGRWDCGAGRVEFGETIDAALRREVREEYGVGISAIEPLGYREVMRTDDNGNPSHWIAFDFKVLVPRSEVLIGEPDKMTELAWFPLDAFPEPLHSQFPSFFEKYKNELG